MTHEQPPALATWILEHVVRGNDALIGDLLEEHRRRQSSTWYWGQVLVAVGVTVSKEALLLLALVTLFLVGARFSVPGAHAETLRLLASRAAGQPFGLFSALTGGQLSGVTIFALGILPYVSAALIVQGLAYGWRLLRRRGPVRRALPIVAITRCLAVLLCAAQAIGLALFLERTSAINGGLPIVAHPGLWFRLTTVATLLAGTLALMLLSDLISMRGFTNGMFVVFAAGVLAGLSEIFVPLLTGQADPFEVIGYATVHITIVGVVAHYYRRELVLQR